MQNMIFCIDSYYQLMIAINLTVNCFENDVVDVVLFNTMNDADKICENLKHIGLFRNVFLANTQLNKTVTNSTFLSRLPKYAVYLYSMLCYKSFTIKLLRMSEIPCYDMLFFYGYRPLIQSIYNACLKVNPKIKCYRIDDGMGSYTSEWNMPKPKTRILLEKLMFYMSGFNMIENNVSGFYVPDVNLISYRKNVSYDFLNLPDYSNANLINFLNKIFEYNDSYNKPGKKIIYFGVYGDDWIKRDIAYLREISKFIPKENLIIKVHPRAKADVYKELGIDIFEQTNIPWELFMINNKYTDTIFIAQISSALISSRAIFHRTGKDIYLYKCKAASISLPNISKAFDDFLRDKNENLFKKGLFIPETISDLKLILEESLANEQPA